MHLIKCSLSVNINGLSELSLYFLNKYFILNRVVYTVFDKKYSKNSNSIFKFVFYVNIF